MTDTTVRNAAQTLLDACIQDFGNPDDFTGDDGAVALGEQGDCAVSFKHLRALRDALAAQPSARAQGEAVAVPRQWLRDLVSLADDLHPGDSDGNVIDLIMDGYGYSRAGEEKDGPTPYDRSGDKALWDHRVDNGPNPYRATPAQPDTGDPFMYAYQNVDPPHEWKAYRQQLRRGDGSICPGVALYKQPDTGDVAALREARAYALEMTRKHGNPDGTDYEQGQNDMGFRWVSQLDTMIAALSKPNAPGREG